MKDSIGSSLVHRELAGTEDARLALDPGPTAEASAAADFVTVVGERGAGVVENDRLSRAATTMRRSKADADPATTRFDHKVTVVVGIGPAEDAVEKSKATRRIRATDS